MIPQKPTIVVRYYQDRDRDGVHTLFRRAMTHGDGSPVHLVTTSGLLKPLDRLGCIVSGIAFPLSLAPTGLPAALRCSLFFIGILGAGVGYLFKHMMASSINSFVENALADDLGNIPKQYQLVSSDSSESGALVPKGTNCFWVAEAHWEGSDKKPEIVGIVGLDETSKADKGLIELRRMAVSPDHRRLGIAKKLIAALLEHARKQNVRSVYLNSSTFQQPAVNLYKKLGWTETHRVSFAVMRFLGLKDVYIVHMALDVEAKQSLL